MKYKILFSREMWYSVTIEAVDEDEARELFYGGQYSNEESAETQPDYWDERIIEVEETEE